MTDLLELGLGPTNYNPDNERNILAAVLHGANPHHLPITPPDFWEPAHEYLYRRILDLAANHITPDFSVLYAKLNPNNRDDKQTLDLLPDLLSRGPSVHIKILADTLIEARRIRHLQNTAVRIQQAIHEGTTADSITEAILADLKGHDTNVAAASRTLAEIMPDVIDRIERGVLHGLSTPWPDLDSLIHGLRGGELTIIAGRPAQGKSLIGQNWVTYHTNHHDQHALFVSMEMRDIQIGTRIVADVTSIEQDDLMSPKIMNTGGRWGKVNSRMDRLTDNRIHIASKSGQTLAQIAREANRIHTRCGLGLLAVDYLQLITPRDNRSMNREQQVGEISRGLKTLALDLDIPVLALSQFNRAGERDNSRPRLSDLRESGSLEQDADNVIGIHRPDPAVASEGELLVLKARQGRTGDVSVHMATEYARIGSRTRGTLS